MRFILGNLILTTTFFFANFGWAGPLCTDPSGFDLLTERPLIESKLAQQSFHTFPVFALSELEMLRLAEDGIFDEIGDAKTRARLATVAVSLSDPGVVGLWGENKGEVVVNGPAVFVVALDPVTNGEKYFEFKNYYTILAEVDGTVSADWVFNPVATHHLMSGRPDCSCSAITNTACGVGQPGPGGGNCKPDIGCVEFPHDQVSLSNLPGPAIQSVPNACTGGNDYIDTFGNQVRGMLAFDQWYERALAQNFVAPIGGEFGHCELCKKILPEACGDYPYVPPIELTPPIPECGGSKQVVDRICQVSLVDSSSGFCGVVRNVPDDLGPFCLNGSVTGGLINGAPGTVQTHPGELRGCQVPVSEVCKRIEPGESEYCDTGAEAERVAFWTGLLGCGVGTEPGSGFECLGSNGICQSKDGMEFCSYCVEDRCTRWVERGIGDPRRFKPDSKGCDDTGCEEVGVTIEIFGIVIEFGGGQLFDIRFAESKPDEEVDDSEIEPFNGEGANHGGEGASRAARTVKEPVASGKGNSDGTGQTAGDPVVVQTGELVLEPADIALASPVFPFEFRRSYSSQSDFQGVLGSNWTHNFETRLEFVRPGLAPSWTSLYCSDFWPVVTCLIRHHQHTEQLYVYDPITKRYVPHLGTATSHIVDKGADGFVLFEREGGMETFNAQGYLTSRQDRFGNGFDVELEYTPLGSLQRRYCAKVGLIVALNEFDLDPLVCAYLGFALKDQPAELLARTGWIAPGSVLLPPDNALDVKNWEHIIHTPNPPPPFVYMPSSSYTSWINRANYYLQHLLGLGYMVEPASGSAHFRVKKVVERRHKRALTFSYHDETVDPSSSGAVRFGLLKHVAVSNSGQRVEFEYDKPDYGKGFNEFFLTRAKKVYSNVGTAYTDNSQLIANAQNQPLDLVYTYYTGPNLWTEYDHQFFEHFEKTAGCSVVDEVPCGYLKSEIDGNPCHLTELERLRYLSRISDNIVRIERAGKLELETSYEVDLYDQGFDRVVSQNYGGRLDGTFTLDYVSAGPAHFSSTATPMGERVQNTNTLNAELVDMYPLEESPIYLHDRPATDWPGCATATGQQSHPMCGTYDPPRVPNQSVTETSGTCDANFVHTLPDGESSSCRWDGSHQGLPGFEPTFDYFPAGAGERPQRTYLTCDQLATRHLFDVQSSGNVGSTYWDTDGKRWEQWLHTRDAIENDLRRICGWAKTVDREGVARYYGLNFRAQSLVEATHLIDGTWHIIERTYNADGKLTREWDARENVNASVGYTTYQYHELTPESDLGWGSTWPSPWATRHNLLREEYVAAQPVWEFGESAPSERVYTRYAWEELFNQVRYVEYGKVVDGLDVPISAETRIYDYQEFEPLPVGMIPTENNSHPLVQEMVRQISVGKHWPDTIEKHMEGANEVHTHYLDNSPALLTDGTQTNGAPRIANYYLQGGRLYGQDINGDGMDGTNGQAFGLPILISRKDFTQNKPGADTDHSLISWTTSGQPAVVRDSRNVQTKFFYHRPEANYWQGQSPANGAEIGTGKTGFLARIERDRTDETWPAEFAPQDECPDLEGPYRFLGACGSGKQALFNALQLPQSVQDAINQAVSGQKEVEEFRYSAEGHLFRKWNNGLMEEHRHDADGRLVRTIQGARQTDYLYTPQGWVFEMTVIEGSNVVAHETYAHDRIGNIIGKCVSRTGLACQNAFDAAFAPGDASPPGTVRTLYAYDREDRLVRESDPLGRVTEYQLDEFGRVVAEWSRDCIGVNCQGQERMVRREFDVDGRLVAVHHGNVQTVQTLGAGTETFDWDDFGRLRTHVDRRGNAWQRAWDRADRLRAKMISNTAFPTPLSSGTEVSVWEYGPFGRVSAEIQDPEGFAITTEFVRRPGGEVYEESKTGFSPVYTSSDARGRPLVRRDETGLDVWTYSADGLESTHTRVTLQDGSWDVSVSETNVVDRHGMPITRTLANPSEIRNWAFSRTPSAGQWRFEEVDPSGRVNARIRDLAGFTLMSEVATPQGLDITQYTVNARGDVLRIDDPSGGVTTQKFNEFGERTSLKKPSPLGNDSHDYEWDEYGRLTTWERQGERVEWVWDTDGTLEAEELVVGGVRTRLNEFGWDHLGRKTQANGLNPQVKQALGLQAHEARVDHHWGWDSVGRLDTEWVSAAGVDRGVMHSWSLTSQGTWQVTTDHTDLQTVTFTQTTTLDGAGRRQLDQTGFGFPSSEIDYTWTGRHPLGRVHNASTTVSRTLNDFGDLTRIRAQSGNDAPFYTEDIERDVLGRVRSHLQASELWSDDRWQAYEYDERHALSASWEGWIAPGSAVGVGTHTAATNASVVSAATSLGAASSVRKRGALGNLEHITQGANDIWEATRSASGHRLTEISDQSTTWTIEHDALGRVTAALDKSYDYDPLGRLVLARDTNDVILESYLMDGNGRVVQVNRHTSDTVYETSVIAYDGAQMVSSWTEGTGGGWSQDWQAVWGPSQDELVEFHNFHTGQTYVVVQDHRNSIAALFDDATGSLHRVMHYTPEGLSTHYDRYGLRCDEETSLTVTCTETNIPFGFNGMWRSSATGLSYMRNRWYSPQLAQFMSHDPLEYIDSYNMYAFAALDPINFWDPWGLEGAGLSFFEKAAKTIGSAAESVGDFLSDLFSSSGGSEVADGVGDYFMWGSWGELLEVENYEKGLKDWGNESKRRINNAGEVLDIRNFSPMVNDIEGLLDSANRLIHAIESGDNRELGTLGTEAALSTALQLTLRINLLKGRPKIEKGKQGKHQEGHNNFVPERGRSVLSHPNPQKLIDRFSGKGEQVGTIKIGKPGSKEIVDFGEHIGTWINKEGTQRLDTTVGVIHYSKKGAHIVPAYPID